MCYFKSILTAAITRYIKLTKNAGHDNQAKCFGMKLTDMKL